MLKKPVILYTICGFMALSFLLAGLVLAAKPKMVVNVNPSKGNAVVRIPARAVEVAPGIFSLGIAVDNGELVEGYAIVRYKKNFGKPGTSCGNGICEPGENANKCPSDCGGSEVPDTSSCYDFFAKGAKWKTIEPYILNPSNVRNMDESFIVDNLAKDIAKWETAAETDIIGLGLVSSSTLEADLITPDNQNEVYFSDIDEPGAIAITIVWGIFGGPPSQRKLVEWDQVYDQIDFDWSASGEADKMDFENIATHELGHSVGMGDLYTTSCSEITMYGYADYGETKKQTLELDDITGVQKLY